MNLIQKLKQFSKDFLVSALRTGWAFFIVFLGGLFIAKGGREILTNQAGVLAWKFVLVGSAVAVAHLVRRQLFPYLDLSAELEKNNVAGAITFAATALIYAAIILAVCSGL